MASANRQVLTETVPSSLPDDGAIVLGYPANDILARLAQHGHHQRMGGPAIVVEARNNVRADEAEAPPGHLPDRDCDRADKDSAPIDRPDCAEDAGQ